MSYCMEVGDFCPRCRNDKHCLFTGKPKLVKSLDKCPMNYYIKKDILQTEDEQTSLFNDEKPQRYTGGRV